MSIKADCMPQSGRKVLNLHQRKLKIMGKEIFKVATMDAARVALATTDYLNNDILLVDDVTKLDMPTSPKRLTFIFIALCTSGSASFMMDTRRLTVEKGDVLIISDRHVVDKYTATPDMKGVGIMMSANFFYEIVRNVSEVSSMLLFSKEHPVFKFSEKEIDLFFKYINMLKDKIANASNRFRRSVVRTLLLAMFYDLSDVMYRMQPELDSRRTRGDSLFTEFIQLLEDNYRHERRVSWYAEQLCITPKYLSETIKRVSKRTPNQWIDNYVLLAIRVSLKNTPKSIKEIAEDLNFPNQSFLGKFFKEHVGMSPTAYRKS